MRGKRSAGLESSHVVKSWGRWELGEKLGVAVGRELAFSPVKTVQTRE